jgi:hypothetical protein
MSDPPPDEAKRSADDRPQPVRTVPTVPLDLTIDGKTLAQAIREVLRDLESFKETR